METSASPKTLQFSDSDAFYRELAAHIERGEPVQVQTDFTNTNQVPERLARMIDLPSAQHHIADSSGVLTPLSHFMMNSSLLLEVLKVILKVFKNWVRQRVNVRVEVDQKGRLVVVVMVDPKPAR